MSYVLYDTQVEDYVDDPLTERPTLFSNIGQVCDFICKEYDVSTDEQFDELWYSRFIPLEPAVAVLHELRNMVRGGGEGPWRFLDGRAPRLGDVIERAMDEVGPDEDVPPTSPGFVEKGSDDG